MHSFQNEWVAGDGRKNLHDFLEEQAGLQGGSTGRNCTVFGRNWLGAWKSKLCNSHKELEIGSWVIGNRNYAISNGNKQLAVGSLVLETKQFLGGTGNLLLGTTCKENCTEADRLTFWSYLCNFWAQRIAIQQKAFSWKMCNFLDEQVVDCREDWLGKMRNFLWETRKGTWCLFDLSTQFP